MSLLHFQTLPTLSQLLTEAARREGAGRPSIGETHPSVPRAGSPGQLSGLEPSGPRLAKGDRVALLMNNSIEYVESFFAISRAGGIVVPVNTFLTPAEISYILKDCGAAV